MESVVSAFPLVQDLNRLMVLLLMVNAVLTGLVILFAWRAAHYRDRLEELEASLAPPEEEQEEKLTVPPPTPPPLSDDRPIPPARDTRRQIWRPGLK